MQFKLSKFATIAKELNEESALRKHEAIKLEDELATVKAERDTLAQEVEQLRASVAQHSILKDEHQALVHVVTQYETQGLLHAKATTDQKDIVIRDLANRLERTMDALERERSKQHQQHRRQIIFPTRASHPIPMQMQGSTTTDAMMQEEVRLAKAEARMAHEQLTHAQAGLARMEAAYRARTEQLELQLAKRNAFTHK